MRVFFGRNLLAEEEAVCIENRALVSLMRSDINVLRENDLLTASVALTIVC